MRKLKPIRWIGTSLEKVRAFPVEVRRDMGYALQFAQSGTKHPSAMPLRGFGGAGVLEIVADHRGDTYRAVYAVRFADIVYVLHAFQKKSKSGIKTPKKEIDLIQDRLRCAEQDYQELMKAKRKESR